MFTNKDKFAEFVNKNNGDMQKVAIDVIGNAFMNAIYIDQESAVQSTYFHENAHIYWNALSDSDPVKKSLIELFKNDYSSMQLWLLILPILFLMKSNSILIQLSHDSS